MLLISKQQACKLAVVTRHLSGKFEVSLANAKSDKQTGFFCYDVKYKYIFMQESQTQRWNLKYNGVLISFYSSH